MSGVMGAGMRGRRGSTLRSAVYTASPASASHTARTSGCASSSARAWWPRLPGCILGGAAGGQAAEGGWLVRDGYQAAACQPARQARPSAGRRAWPPGWAHGQAGGAAARHLPVDKEERIQALCGVRHGDCSHDDGPVVGQVAVQPACHGHLVNLRHGRTPTMHRPMLRGSHSSQVRACATAWPSFQGVAPPASTTRRPPWPRKQFGAP